MVFVVYSVVTQHSLTQYEGILVHERQHKTEHWYLVPGTKAPLRNTRTRAYLVPINSSMKQLVQKSVNPTRCFGSSYILCRKGNEHFKAKEFFASIQSYTHAIDIDDSNHVYYGNRR